MCVCSGTVLTKLITGNGHMSVVVALCVCIVLCTEMRTSNIGHLPSMYTVLCSMEKTGENLCLVIFCARLVGGKCYVVIGSHM